MDKTKAMALFNSVDGLISPYEGEALYDTAIQALERCASKNIVEVGSFLGKSTIALAAAASNFPGARIYAIDPHSGEMMQPGETVEKKDPTFDRFLENIHNSGLRDWIVPIKKRSVDVDWALSLAMLFIDGLHDYESVSGDYGHFRRHVESKGVVAFHDYHDGFPAVDEFVDGITTRELERKTVAGFLIICHMKSETPRFEIPLVTTTYIAPESRIEDLSKALSRNLVNPFIDAIHLLVEEADKDYEQAIHTGPLKSFARNLDHRKIKKISLGRRATYRDLFDHANHAFPGRVVAVSNADIWFDTTIGNLEGASLDGRFLALTRSDMVHAPHISQDTWIFKAPLPFFECGWFLGPRGSDNKLAYEAARSGLEVSNTPQEIRTHHVHSSNYRVGSTVEQLPGPYLFVPASPLEKLRTPKG